MKKKPYYAIKFDSEQTLVFTAKGLMKWIKDDVGDMETIKEKSYTITVTWLTDKEYGQLKEANI